MSSQFKSEKQLQLAQLLCDAILADDLDGVISLLDDGADPNVLTINDVSAIHLAAGADSRSDTFVDLLLQYSADPNLRNSEGVTAVLIAASYGHCNSLKLLLEAGGDVWTSDDEGNDVYQFAVESSCQLCQTIVTLYQSCRSTEAGLDDTVTITDSNDSSTNSTNSTGTGTGTGTNNTGTGTGTNNSISSSVSDVSVYLSCDSTLTQPVNNSLMSTHSQQLCDELEPVVSCTIASVFVDVQQQQTVEQTDLTNVSMLSDSKNTTNYCLLHSVCIERRPITDSDSELSLVEMSLAPLHTHHQSVLPSLDASYAEFSDSSSQPPSLTIVTPSCSCDSSLLCDLMDNYSLLSENSSCTTQNNTDRLADREHCSDIKNVSNRCSNYNVGQQLSSTLVIEDPKCPKCSANCLECSYLANTDILLCDWLSTSVSSDVSSEFKVIDVPAEVKVMSATQLRNELLKFGEQPGPIVDSTRKTYEQRITQLLAGATTTNGKNAEFLSEVMCAIRGQLDISNLKCFEDEMIEPFINPDVNKKWREGIHKTYFNYLLLDPRVTQNLPVRVKTIGVESGFEVFLRSVFYVGKGKRSRPYEHFKEATKCYNKATTLSRKVSQIIDIWNCGLGVVSLHIFQNIIATEAFTREACIIDALGLDRLTNQCRGQYYGPASSWSNKRQRQIGVRLLYNSYKIFLYEGERQIRINDV